MNSFRSLHGKMPNGKGVSTSFFASLFIFLFGFSSLLSAQSAPRGASSGAVITAETWDDLGGGVTGTDVVVKTIVEHNGYVYVGGSFESAGGVSARNIARFNLSNSQWEAIGSGTDDGMGTMVNEIVVHNGLLYVGGYFTQMNGQAIRNLAVYNPTGGGSWSSIGTFGHSSPEFINVFALHVFGDDLYVGGEFQSITKDETPLDVQHLARYNITGGTWHRVGTYTSSSPSDIPFMDGMVTVIDGNDTDLVFGGAFVQAGSTTVNGLVRYTPGTQTWTAIGSDGSIGMGAIDGFPGFVNDMAMGSGVVYVSGEFMHSGSGAVNRLGSYSIADGSWTSLGDNFDGPIIKLLVHNDSELFVAGEFTQVDGSNGAGVGQYTVLGGFGFWFTFGSVLNEGGLPSVSALGMVNGQLVAGGLIADAAGVPVNNIARWSFNFGGGNGDGGGDLPDVPLSAPTNTLTGVSVDPLFDWAAPEGVTVTSYSLFIDDTNPIDESAPYSKIEGIATTQYQYDSQFGLDLELFGNTTYYWIVKAYDGTDVVAQTTTPFSFTTESINTVTPTLVAPVDAQDVSVTPTFTWSKDDLAVSYVLEYQQGATINESATAIPLALDDLTVDGDNYTYKLPQGSALTAGTQYTWQVSVLGADPFDIKISGTASFTTVDLSPGAFTWDFDPLERIVDGSFGTYNTSWTQSDGATSYELDFKIGEQPFTAFGDPVVVNAPSTSYILDNTKLVDGFTYTVELTAVNEFGRTSADPLTIVYTPTKPVAVSPVDEAPVGATTSFTWESTENFGIIPGNVLVQILYTNDENADPVANSSDGIQFEFPGTIDVEESKTLTELFATQNDVDVTQFLEANMGNTLYWRVSNKSIRINEADAETQREVVWSDLASFSIPAVPQAFNLSTPTNNSTVETFLPTFTWQQSQNATSYKLQIATQTNFSDPIYESPLIGRGDNENTVTYTLPEGEELDFLTGYYWRVIASSDGGDLTSGHFTFETHFGRDIEIVSPDDGLTYESVAQAGAAEYSWPHIFGDADEFYYATQFFIDEARVLGDRADVISEGNVIGPNPINTLRSGFTYNWYVEGYASYSGSRDTPYLTSDSRTFTIEAEKPTVTVPVAQALLASNTMFSWSAEETIQLMDGGRIEGDFDIQLLTVNDPNADPQTNPEDGYHFTMRGLSLELNESNTLDGLVSLNENVTLDDILSREGETLYFRVRINPEYSLLTQERVTLWSDLIPVRVPAMPRAFDLLTPADELSEVSNTPTFTWEQSQFADTYVLNVSLNEDLSNPVFPPMNLSRGEDPNEVSFTLPTEDRLLFGQTYFWQVTAIGTGGEIKSGIREFSTLSEGIVLTSPEDGKVFASAQELEDEIFMWESYSNAEDFSDVTVIFSLLFKDQSSEYSRLRFLTTKGITSRSIPSTSLVHGFTYSWEINNVYNNGSATISTLSDRRTFRINAEKPVLSGPISGAEIMSTTPFEWTTEERFNAGGITETYYGGEFHVQILFDETTDVEQLTSEQGYQFLVDGTEDLTESFTLEQLFATLDGDDAPTIDDLMSRAGQTLYWRVKIDPEYPELEQDREVVWSDVESFVIGTLPWEIVFESDQVIVPQYELSEPIVVEIQDAFGNPVRNELPASLSIESTDNITITDLNGSAITSLQINPTGSVQSFRVKATNPVQASLTISGQGFNAKTKSVTITPFSGGTGVDTDPYIITNVHQLQTVADKSIYQLESEFDNNEYHFALGKDIDASETAQWNNNKGFDPIDDFLGSFDGRTYSITNLNINRPEESGVGLFSMTGGLGTPNVILKNITLKGVMISGQDQVGGIAGNAVYTSISNSWVDGSITSQYDSPGGMNYTGATGGIVGTGQSIQIISSSTSVTIDASGDIYTGGLVGELYEYSSIQQSYSTSTIEGNNGAGGLVGFIYNSTISDSYFEGSISGNFGVGGIAGLTDDSQISRSWSSGSVAGTERVGGIVGNNDEDNEIKQSFSSSSVTGESQVGGLVGMNDDYGKIVNSFATGSVTGKNEVGGLVGQHYAGSEITSSYSTGKVLGDQSVGGLVGVAYDAVVSGFWDTQTSGQETSAGGTGKTTADMKARSTFTDAGWDFNGIWIIDPFKNNGYPYLIGVGSFEPVVPGVDPPVLNTPVETDVFSFSWSGDETAQYVFEIDDDKENLEAAGPSVSRTDITYAGLASGNSLELASGKLTAGTKFYWRVSLVVKSGDNTAYVTSEVGEFTPKPVPSVITVSSPANNASNVAVSGIKFEWEPDGNATKYQVLVYESTNLNAAVIDKTVDAIGDNTGLQSALFDDVAALKNSTEYKWRVIGYNGTKRGELNDLVTFTTENNPISITLVGPIQPAPTPRPVDDQFIFSVSTSGIADGTDLIYEIAETREKLLQANPLTPDEDGLLVYEMNHPISQPVIIFEGNFDDGQTYYWRVSTQAENSDGYISSEIGEFTVTRTPAQPVITSPAATNVPITGVIFTWNTDPFADAYQLTLREKDGEQTFDVTVPAIIAQSQSYSLNNQQRLFNNTEYEFSVTGINGDRVGFTRTLTFRTVAATSTKVRLSYSMELTWVLTNPNTLFKSKVANEICEKLDLDTSECSRIEVVTSTAKDTPSEPDLINAGDAIILLIWEQPETPEEFPITHYSIQYRPAGADYWNQFSRPESPDTIAVFTGFDPETRYDIRIAGVNENGIGEYSEPIEVETISMEDAIAFIEAVAAEIIATSIEVEEIPTEFALFQNYPNPFNPTTTVRFALPEPSEVQLEVYSILGQRIAVLSTGLKPAGYHSLQLDATRWASGTYIYRLRAGDRIFTKKLLLIK